MVFRPVVVQKYYASTLKFTVICESSVDISWKNSKECNVVRKARPQVLNPLRIPYNAMMCLIIPVRRVQKEGRWVPHILSPENEG